MSTTTDLKREFQKAMREAYDAKRLEEARDLAWDLAGVDGRDRPEFQQWRRDGWQPKG